MNLTVHNTVLLDIWWNMLIKFSKQIGNSFAKIIDKKVYPNPAKHLRWSFFRKLLLASEANSESSQTSKMELFGKIVKSQKRFTVFAKNSILDVSQSSEYTSELASRVKNV